jgi:hypothetical protein
LWILRRNAGRPHCLTDDIFNICDIRAGSWWRARADQPKVKQAVHKIMHAANVPQARSAARRLAERFQYPLPPDT